MNREMSQLEMWTIGHHARLFNLHWEICIALMFSPSCVIVTSCWLQVLEYWIYNQLGTVSLVASMFNHFLSKGNIIVWSLVDLYPFFCFIVLVLQLFILFNFHLDSLNSFFLDPLIGQHCLKILAVLTNCSILIIYSLAILISCLDLV